MEEFDFAHEVLYNKVENKVPLTGINFKKTLKIRDEVFKSILASFCTKPIRAFQIGAIETFNFRWRIGSGWSDLIWGDYIKTHGGSLTIVDINLDNLANSTLAAVKLGYIDQLVTLYGNAIDHIEEGYDIYYLDGSDDPQEMLDQFNKIKHTNSVVIMDDYSIKGTLVDELSIEEGYEVTVHAVANDVAVIDLRK